MSTHHRNGDAWRRAGAGDAVETIRRDRLDERPFDARPWTLDPVGHAPCPRRRPGGDHADVARSERARSTELHTFGGARPRIRPRPRADGRHQPIGPVTVLNPGLAPASC